MSTTIYRDSEASAIFIEDANGAQFLNSLHATVDSSLVSITDTAKNFDLVSGLAHTEIVDQNGDAYGATATEACDALNAIFTTSGSTGEIPVITSNTTINLTVGDTLNYELTADYGVGYEWDSLPSGIVTVEGNIRKLVGGSSLTAGTYTPTVKAINYFGEDSEIITINVASPSFANTKSIQFDNFDYLSATASNVSSLSRASNGAGASDAWSISLWVKPAGTLNNQTLFYYGGNDNNNEGHIMLRYHGDNTLQSVELEYGSNNNCLRMITTTSSFPRNTWTHLLLTYDGDTTGSSSGDLSDYYSRFNFYIDGSLGTTSDSHSNYGYSGSINSEIYQIGKRGTGTRHIRGGGKIDEIAVWDSDQSANVADIYNSGSAHNLSLLSNPPSNWSRMGDGDTFPTLIDNIGSADFTMNNMTVANIVNDVP